MQFFKRKKLFTVRSPERDSSTDKNRVLQISQAIELLAAEIQSERDGLSKRYMEIERDAGFFLDSLESDPDNSAKNAKIFEFEGALVAYKRRIRTLGMQVLELKYMQTKLAQKFDEIEKDNASLI